VDNDFVLKQFGEIEHKVEKLIENCKAQAVANSELKNKLKSLEEQIQGKVEAEKITLRKRPWSDQKSTVCWPD
jgi:regulator of replication initiation timing